MARKLSLKKPVGEFQKAANTIHQYFTETAGLKEEWTEWTASHAIIELYREFELLMLNVLVGLVNQDTSTISAARGVNFPKHLTSDVCKYLIIGNGYFDFKGRSGLIEIVKTVVPSEHWLSEIISDKDYTATLDRLSALRNHATHGSEKSKRAVIHATSGTKFSTTGAWLRKENRFETIVDDLKSLASKIEKKAPF